MNLTKFGKHLFIIQLSLVILFCSACGEDGASKRSNTTFTIGINADPEKINPVFNPKVKAREIYNAIFLPLADFHPETFELTPILTKSISEPQILSNDTLRLDVILREAAQWADGVPITADDYIFAIKAVKHPQTLASAWRPYLDIIYDIRKDVNDPKRFSVYCDRTSMLALETVYTFYPLPKHIYDPEKILESFPLSLFLDAEALEEEIEANAVLANFATAFNDPKRYREDVFHAGPYQLKEWVTDQYVLLTKVDNYWAKATDNPYLLSGADTLLFKIIKDEIALATLLQSGGIDMTKSLSKTSFTELKQQNELYSFSTPETMRIAYLGLNNRDPKLKEKSVRQALAHCLDVEAIIKVEQQGLGRPIPVLLPPKKPGFPQALPPRLKDIEKSKQLLLSAGWSDTNSDGTVDKVVEGSTTELVFDMHISGSQLSKTIAFLLKEGAKEAGMDINIIQKDTRSYLRENVFKHDFEIAALSASFDAADEDPFPRWHSESAGLDGRNRVGFINEKADSLIQLVRNTYDAEERRKYYREFQEVFYSECPVIPLFCPQDAYVIRKSCDGIITSKRPGYFANTFSCQ